MHLTYDLGLFSVLPAAYNRFSQVYGKRMISMATLFGMQLVPVDPVQPERARHSGDVIDVDMTLTSSIHVAYSMYTGGKQPAPARI